MYNNNFHRFQQQRGQEGELLSNLIFFFDTQLTCSLDRDIVILEEAAYIDPG